MSPASAEPSPGEPDAVPAIRAELLPYVGVANLIAGQFPEAEVALHDLTRPESSVVYVTGANATGRAIGQSFDHLVSTVLVSPRFKDDLLAGYFFESEAGARIRSSSLILRDADGKATAMLCINVDISAHQQLIAQLSAMTVPPDEDGAGTSEATGSLRASPRADPSKHAMDTTGRTSTPEKAGRKPESGYRHPSSASTVEQILESLIVSAIEPTQKLPLPRTQAVELVGFLDAKGIFLVKGAVAKVASLLGVSNVTVYSYLDQARGKRTRSAR